MIIYEFNLLLIVTLANNTSSSSVKFGGLRLLLEGEPFVGDATFLEVVPLEGGFDFGFFALAIVMAIVMFELFLFARVCVEMCFFVCLSCFCLRECVSRCVFCGMCCTCCGVGF